MKSLIIAFIPMLFCIINCAAGEIFAQTAPLQTEQQPDATNTIPATEAVISPQNLASGKRTERAVSVHKVNYFSINHWPASSSAQIKFQISMKFRILEPNLYVLKYNLFPAYIGYTQKSLWNEGQSSRPFEESNYNPEFFLDYPVNFLSIGRVKLRNIIFCPLEHQSNGLSGLMSRSWNRQYITVKFGFTSKEKLEIMNAFLADKALLYIKLWRASGYSGQDDYLGTIGSKSEFPEYMGVGETGVSIRNFLWGGSLKNHQLDIKTPIFRSSRKKSYECEFRQQLPYMNFALYLQYWYGYGETLLRFNQFSRRGFAGFSFSY